MRTGYFANRIDFTKVHLVDEYDIPMCKSKINKDKIFQFNANGIEYTYIECAKCKKIALDLFNAEYNKKILDNQKD